MDNLLILNMVKMRDVKNENEKRKFSWPYQFIKWNTVYDDEQYNIGK